MREPLRDSERLKHILEAIGYIEGASVGITKDRLASDYILRHALTWNIMVIGEAAICNNHYSSYTRFPPEFL